MSPNNTFDPAGYFTWIFLGSQRLSHMFTALIIIGFLLITCFPIWPRILKVTSPRLSVLFVVLCFVGTPPANHAINSLHRGVATKLVCQVVSHPSKMGRKMFKSCVRAYTVTFAMYHSSLDTHAAELLLLYVECLSRPSSMSNASSRPTSCLPGSFGNSQSTPLHVHRCKFR